MVPVAIPQRIDHMTYSYPWINDHVTSLGIPIILMEFIIWPLIVDHGIFSWSHMIHYVTSCWSCELVQAFITCRMLVVPWNLSQNH